MHHAIPRPGDTLAVSGAGCLALLAQGAEGLHAWRLASGAGPVPPLPATDAAAAR